MRRILSCLVMALVVLSLPGTKRAQGAAKLTYTVISTTDSGVGSLRWAINQANATSTTPARVACSASAYCCAPRPFIPDNSLTIL